MIYWLRRFAQASAASLALFAVTPVAATEFTRTVPGTGVQLPDQYPEAGGVAIVLTGANGNIYYQFSDPDGAFVGFQFRGQPAAFRGNPFTINDPISLDCGFSSCETYFGGSIARIDIRFSAYDGDTQVGGFDFDDISLRINGFDVGSWSNRQTERTNTSGTTSFGFENGFGNNVFNTGWFSSTNAALLANILEQNGTVTQVFDEDPDDNYWDFRRGPRLPQERLRTIAPGYDFTKTVDNGVTSYSAVGDEIDYTYVVRNIGSVDIDDIQVVDDRIVDVDCGTDRSLAAVPFGSPNPETLTCTATYVITQADIDAGEVVNIAQASGDPAFGELGAVTDTATVTGPVRNSQVSLTKVGSPDPFGPAGSPVTYEFVISNDGNTTLTNVTVTDPMLPGLDCTFDAIPPAGAGQGSNTRTCEATYIVQQGDVDDFALSGTLLRNDATVQADGPEGPASDTAFAELSGQPAAPALSVVKTALQTEFDAIGDDLVFRIAVTNDGNVTWPGPPTLTDTLDGATLATVCPPGSVAPDATVICTAEYTIQQKDLDAGGVTNRVVADITVGGQAADPAQDDVTVPASVVSSLAITKRLQAGSPDPFDTIGQQLVYEYVLRNTGTVTLTVAADDVIDDRVAVTCPAGDIGPGAEVICTSAAYEIDQDDLNLGFVTNTASAVVSDPNGAPVDSGETDLTVQADQAPALTMVKTAPPVQSVDYRDGLSVVYSFDVTNSGNVVVPGPIIVTDDRIGAPFECSAGDLAVGDSITCDATYVVTVEDAGNGFVTNTAFATGADGTRSMSDSATIPQEGTPELTLAKTATTASFDAVSDQLVYDFTITNTGDVILNTDGNPIRINDPDATIDPGCVLPAPGLLYPVGSANTPQSFTCTGRFNGLQQSDLDAGSFTNTAQAEFDYTPPGGGPVQTIRSAPSDATVDADITPDFTFAKVSGDDFANVGDEVRYTLSVTNGTNQTLSSITIRDPLVPGYTCDLVDVGPLATVSCPAQVVYVVDQDDLDRGFITNTATARATSPEGVVVNRTASEQVDIDPAAQTRSLDFAKSSDAPSFSGVGDRVDYTLAVTNTGNLTLTNVVVEDPDLGLTCAIPRLAPGITDNSCVGFRVMTQDDVDAGSYRNDATASADGVAPVTDFAEVTGPARTALFDFSKSADMTRFTSDGDRVRFTLRLENTGNATIRNITLTDTLFTPTLTCTIPELAPGDVDTSCFGTYPVGQPEIDAGFVENTASFVGTGADGTPLSDTASVRVPGPAADPAITVVKREALLPAPNAPDGAFALNTAETYAFTVTNTGNVTLTSVRIDDPLTAFACTLADLAPGDSVTTCADGTTPLQASYTPVQADVDVGALSNTVEVFGTPPAGPEISASDTLTLGGPAQDPALTLTKTSTGGAGFTAIDDVLTYQYTVRNSGNVTLTERVTIADDRISVTCPAMPSGGLAPGADLICVATDRVDQDDLDLGFVDNTATASISQPVVPSSLYPSGLATVASNTEDVRVTALQDPSIRLVKRIRPGTPTTFDGPGNLGDPANENNLIYEFLVTNDGNVTLTEPILVDDPDIGATLTCSPDGLDVGETVTCSATWAPDQADVDLGFFDNTATATSDFGPTALSDTDSLRVLALQQPSMTLAKDFVSLTNNNTFGFNETATYRFTITNTGNTTLIGPFTIDDNFIGSFVCVPGDIAPGVSVDCTQTYVVTQEDVDLGSITNVAAATDDDGVTTPLVSETIPEDVNPALTLEKTADATEITAEGQIVRYTYVVRNTSEGAIVPSFSDPILVFDDRAPGPIDCTPGSPLLVNQQTTCFFDYTVTQADLDNVGPGLPDGFVRNSARAETDFASRTVVSNADTVTLPGVAANASIETLKSFVNDTNPGAPEAAAGDSLTFTVTVTNTGERTVSGILVTDPLIPGLTCDVPAPINLAPDAVTTCSGTYVVSQEDIDNQSLANTATAEGSAPDGTVIRDDDVEVVAVVADAPELRVTKALIPSPTGTSGVDFADPGALLRFRITVENIGNITVDSIEVTDTLVPGTCTTVGTLAPGESDDSCVFDYEVLQSDINVGEVNNTAMANGTPRTGALAPASGSERANGPAPEPALGIAKVGTGPLLGGGFDAALQEISYVYTVANQGNVTLNRVPELTDDRIASTDITCDPLPPGGLEPSDTLECRATYIVTQDDVDAGEVVNIVDVVVQNDYGPDPIVAQTTETVPGIRRPELEVVKAPSTSGPVVENELITYTYTLTNTGNVRLRNVRLEDLHRSADGTNPLTISEGGTVAVIEPGDDVELTATYRVTQADIDAQDDLTNIVTVSADAPPGVTLDDVTADAAVTVEAADGMMEVVKTATTVPANLAEGSIIVFTVTVENTGNVTLTNVVPTDSVTRNGAATPLPVNPVPVLRSGDGGVLDALEVDETWTYTVDYTLTQEDVDAGGISNSVTVAAEDPEGLAVSDISDNGAGDGDDPTPVAVAERPALNVLKTVRTPAPARPEVGDPVVFEVTVENTGNVTLDTVALVEDLRRADDTPVTTQPTPIFEAGDAGIAGAIDVGETWTYRVEYALTQEDIDAGGLSNSVTVTAETPTNAPVEDVSDLGGGDGDDPTPLALTPAGELTVLKSVRTAAPAPPAVDDVVIFEVTVENTGNVTLDTVALVEDLRRADDTPVTTQPTPIFEAGDAGTVDAIDVGETWTYRVEYALTQEDIDAGGLSNSVTVTAETPEGVEVADLSDLGGGGGDDPTPVTLAPDGQLEVLKTIRTPAPARPEVGDPIVFEVTVENTGNVTLDTVALTEDLRRADDTPVTAQPTPVFEDGDAGTVDAIDVGETWTYRVEYALTQEDIDAGGLSNSVTVTAETPEGVAVEDVSDLGGGDGDDPTLVTLTPEASIEVLKTLRTAPPARPGVGDTVVFEVTVENTGNVTLDTVALVEDLRRADDTPVTTQPTPIFEDGDAGTADAIDVGETWTYRVEYALTQQDIDAGGLSNSVTVTAETPEGVAVEDVSDLGGGDGDDPTPVGLTPDGMLEVLKTVRTPAPARPVVDNIVVFEITVENIGNVSLDTVALVEDLRRADGTPVTTQPTPIFEAGDAGIADTIDVGETWTYRVEYALTQEDLDAGGLNNSVTVTAETPGGTPVSDVSDTGEGDGDDPTPLILTPEPSLDAIKTLTSVIPAVPAPEQIVSFEIAVTNDGNVTLDPPTFEERLIPTGGPVADPAPVAVFDRGDTDADGAFDVGEVWVYTVDHALRQEDIDAGGFTNQVIVTAEDPFGTDVTDTSDNDGTGGDDDPTAVVLPRVPGIEAAKVALTTATVDGDLLRFEITATNTGNVTLTGVNVSDDVLTRADGTVLTLATGPDFVANDLGSPEGALLPGEMATFRATYTLTQDDVDAGGVSNVAAVSGTPPTGPEVSDPSDPVNVLIPARPALSLVKRLTSGQASLSDIDELLTYEFVVENTGNVTSGPIVVSDPLIENAGGSISCPVTVLAPGQSTVCTGSYRTTQADLDDPSGELRNVATVSDGAADPVTDDVTVPIFSDPGLALLKEGISVTVEGVTYPGVPTERFVVGAEVTYRFTVSNTGNTTIRASGADPLTVTDNLIGTFPCLTADLLPGTADTCTATFVVTVDDVDLGSLTNLATASDGNTTSPQVTETVPAGVDPALMIDKSLAAITDAGGTPKPAFDTAGDILVYDFVVTNSGRASLVRDITVDDALLDAPLVCFTSTAQDPDLVPGETTTCSASYVITQADLDAGEVLNTATANTTFGGGNRLVVSPPDRVTTPAGGAAGLALEKTAASLPLTGLDQVLTYTLRATNTGNRTLSRVSVADPLLPTLSCSAASLAPGAVLECSGPYTVTQADVDAGQIVNEAEVAAIDPQGNGLTADARLVLDTPEAAPAIELVKTSSPEPFGAAGSSIQYRFALRNTGNVTLTNVVVTDPIVTPPFTCTIPRLAVGETDAATCLLGYTVTQADVDAGRILNEASVAADGPRGTTADATGAVATDGAIAAPAIRAEKIGVLMGEAVAGSVVEYTLRVTNPGNVSLEITRIDDVMSRPGGGTPPPELDAPFVFVSGDRNGDGRLDLSEAWLYSARHTLTQEDVDAGGVENEAVVFAQTRSGLLVQDVADDGDDGDGNSVDDPTVTDLTPDPAIEVIKTVASIGTAEGQEAVFTVAVTNTGNVSLTDPAFTDVMTNGAGDDISAGVSAPVLTAGSVTPLIPGETATFELRYVLTQADVDSGSLTNSVTVTAAPPTGPRVSDLSDNGAGDGDDPTEALIDALPDATLVKTAGDPVRVGANLYEVEFTLTAENTGNVTLGALELTDDLAAFANPAVVVDVSGLTGTGFATGGVDPLFDGVGQTETLLADTSLAPGDIGVVTFTVRLDATNGSPAQDNVATLGSNRLPRLLAAAAAVAAIAPSGLEATKSVTPGTAILGDVVTYTIEVVNTGTFAEAGLTLVDELPAGLVPVPDSGRIDGGIVPPAVVAGRLVRWTPVSLAPGARVVATIQVRVTEGPGSFVNRAYMAGPTGQILSNVAEATLVVRPEAVFDCGDVIGRVFDDVNLNGYYDGPDVDLPQDRSRSVIPGPNAEEGLPRARLATVDGTIITTDEFGRFNVPCAALPRDIGSNFTLKLDPSSLPTGYHVTTENPRTIRLTPGTLAKMNFGAALADVVDIALTAQAFPGGVPSDALQQGVARFVANLGSEPVVLRLTYSTAGEGIAAARNRLDAVEALIRQGWPRGRPNPVIERTIAGGR